jgi:hypothetical protein
MITRTTWITRQTTTVRHIRGLLKRLEEANALDYAEVKILTIEDERGVLLPDGQVLTLDNLPAQGLLFIPDDDH